MKLSLVDIDRPISPSITDLDVTRRYLVPPHRNHSPVVQDHVVAGQKLVGTVDAPLEDGAFDPAIGPSVLPGHDAHAVSPLELVEMPHMGTVASGHTERQLLIVSLWRNQS